jgi:hypothetical protein
VIVDNPATYYVLCAGGILTLGVVCYRAVRRDPDRTTVVRDLFPGLVVFAYGLSSLARLDAVPVSTSASDTLSAALWLLIGGMLVLTVADWRADTDA